jgi:hypothetical protein
MTMPDQCDAVDAALDEGADLPRLLLLIVVAGGDQKLIAELLQPSLQRLDADCEDSDPKEWREAKARAAPSRT